MVSKKHMNDPKGNASEVLRNGSDRGIARTAQRPLKKRSRSRTPRQPEAKCIKHENETDHPSGWSESQHYGVCGQSCPCCRSRIEGPEGFGTCLVCDNLQNKS